jgi:thiol-disulfide isomerase/thioredoxin
MLSRRNLLIALSFAMTLALTGASAAMSKKPFDQKAFDAAQASGKPILVEVTAPWCPTCKAQAPTLSKLRGEPRFKEMVTFEVDFDSQKDILRKFNVQKQSTLIVFKGRKEEGRSTGVTDPKAIETLLAKAI